MSETQVFDQVVEILTPYVKNQDGARAGRARHEHPRGPQGELGAARRRRARASRTTFDIEIADEDVDTVNTVGDAVGLICRSCIARRADAASRCRARRATRPRGCSARVGLALRDRLVPAVGRAACASASAGASRGATKRARATGDLRARSPGRCWSAPTT